MANTRPGGPARTPGRRAAAGSSATAAVRGAILLAVILVIGIWVLQRDDKPKVPGTAATAAGVTVPDGAGSTVAGDPGAGVGTTVETIPVPATDRAKIKVLVVNTTTVGKVARNARCDLTPGGWDVLKPVDAKKKNPTKAPDRIYVREELRAEAEAIAQKLGLVASDVLPYPLAASELPVTQLQAQGVDIMVLVGANLAQTYKAKPCTATSTTSVTAASATTTAGN